MTGRDLVSASLRLIGAIAPGESPEASEASDGLSTLNRMLDSWSNENLLIYQVVKESPITLVAGTSTYTLGVGGNITTRPIEIVGASVRDAASSQEYPLYLLSPAEFQGIGNKSLQSNYPEKLYDDGGYPQRTLTLYPIPSIANLLVLLTKRALTSISTLDDDISLPPGYERALVYNLSIDLAPEYGRPIDPIVMQTASESKSSIKRSNVRPSYLKITDVPAGRPSRGFNINTGGTE